VKVLSDSCFCGLVPWKWFSSATTYASNSLIVNAALIQQVYVPKIIFLAIVVATGFYKFLVVLLLLMGFLWIYGYTPNPAWVVLVSHERAAIQELCDEGLWVEQGRVQDMGPVNRVMSAYLKAMTPKSLPPQKQM
jgi:hypothetical protein